MILGDTADQKSIVDLIRAESGWAGGGTADLMERLLSTATEARFPGAILPRHSGNQFEYYLVASSEADWRLLRPIAMAFIGRTTSNFDGSKTVFSSDDPFEVRLLGAGLV